MPTKECVELEHDKCHERDIEFCREMKKNLKLKSGELHNDVAIYRHKYGHSESRGLGKTMTMQFAIWAKKVMVSEAVMLGIFLQKSIAIFRGNDKNFPAWPRTSVPHDQV